MLSVSNNHSLADLHRALAPSLPVTSLSRHWRCHYMIWTVIYGYMYIFRSSRWPHRDLIDGVLRSIAYDSRCRTPAPATRRRLSLSRCAITWSLLSCWQQDSRFGLSHAPIDPCCRVKPKHSNLNFDQNRDNNSMHYYYTSAIIRRNMVTFCLPVSEIWVYQNTVTLKSND